jgi:hypothetical protein
MIALSMVVALLQPAQDTARLTLHAAVRMALERAPLLESARGRRGIGRAPPGVGALVAAGERRREPVPV